ncbi:protease modulator HflK [Rahnella aquatilis]|jgi:regulator of protease activity HflC (stomatin/prohibitin superfamily)|uniref:SPFH domain-containing protein n=1 Tax=Rahnella sp. (strain Y9602) TaxID=2703885 RepID=A0ABW6C513_RAHSY|nr:MULTISPECIES: SPFH domain-containing protein [Rahnella]AZP42384.1 protease modulator HflK [Rahnella aquatilis]AZP46724.1 protease modulator HflK [Rahnella aquatilis]NIA87895.1 protease modulator HflK [Rahnella aceris]
MSTDKVSGTDNASKQLRFQSAATHTRWLSGLINPIMVISSVMYLILLMLYLVSPASVWPWVTGNIMAAMWVCAASLQCARRISRWRTQQFAPAVETAMPEASSGFSQRLISRPWMRPVLRYVDAHVFFQALPAFAAIVLISVLWQLPIPANDAGEAGYFAGSVFILCAFAVLVLERHWTLKNPLEWPEAAKLAPMMRMMIGVFLLSALALMFAREASVWPAHLLMLTGLLPGLVALELFLRALMAMFSPPREDKEPEFIAGSLLAAQICWPPRPLQFVQNELHQHFGIDLRQIWAFHFMRRALLPLAAILLLTGWLLTGISEVPLTQRGIYESFGKPVAVRQPGLHAGLPWPFGRTRMVDNGEVHELTTGSEEPVTTTPVTVADTAEGPAPESANRLWDSGHSSDKSQIIASATRDRQSFQIMNMDVRFVYRIAMNDGAAMASLYHTDNMPVLIRSIANQVLVHDFSSRTLDSLLGSDQTRLAADIGRKVQSQLDHLNSGVELLATVIESIHPPAGAADAYHSVQAAQILAQSAIAGEKGQAAQQLNAAQQFARLAQDTASAQSHENLDQAQVMALRFNAENQAYQAGGQSFLTDRYFSQLILAMQQHPEVLIVDHRIGGGTSPVLDLRNFTLPFTPGADKAAHSVNAETTR